MIKSGSDANAPVMLAFGNDVSEVLIKQQIVKLRVAGVSLSDPVQEFRANDAPAAPDGCDIAKIQIPIVSSAGRFFFQAEDGIRDNFRSVKCIMNCLHKLVPITGERCYLWLRQNL